MACAAAACEDLLRLRLRPAFLRSCGVRRSIGSADGPSAKQWLTRHRHLPKRSPPLRHFPARCRMLASKPSHQSAIYPVQLERASGPRSHRLYDSWKHVRSSHPLGTKCCTGSSLIPRTQALHSGKNLPLFYLSVFFAVFCLFFSWHTPCFNPCT